MHLTAELLEKTSELLDCERAAGVIEELVQEHKAVADGDRRDAAHLRAPAARSGDAHRGDARATLVSAEAPFRADEMDALIDEVESDFVLPDEKREAIRLALMNPVCVITGGPGVGNTTVVHAILQIATKRERDIALAAPTGRAAKRMTQQTSHAAKTLHRLLEWSPEHDGFTSAT